MQIWKPLENLPDTWRDMAADELSALAEVWQEQRERLSDTQSYQKFLDKMRRKIAIETGVIERLYTIDRGTTQLLIEHGIDEAILQHGSTDQPVSQVVALIRDHEEALNGIFDFVASQRNLSTSYIKQLHQFLTRHQAYTEALDQFGNLGQIKLLRGDWKKQPNNPQRNGETYIYCPPEQVAPQMEQLIDWHLGHQKQGVTPDVEAAWLHHRFTQIHPFQDGNGRVARVLASLVFIRARWFPLVITRDDRTLYIEALEKADTGDLKPLVDLFAKAQKQAFLGSLSLSEEILAESQTFKAIVNAAIEKIKKKRETSLTEAKRIVQQNADKLFQISTTRFNIVVQELKQALQSVTTDANVYQKEATPADEMRNGYYRYQIIETAQHHEYYAYLEGYKSWVGLAISTEQSVRIEIILSFHEVGYDHKGVMVCSAFATRLVTVADEPTRKAAEDIESLSDAPFEFTYLEDKTKLEKRFKDWLDAVINVGMEYWRRNI